MRTQTFHLIANVLFNNVFNCSPLKKKIYSNVVLSYVENTYLLTMNDLIWFFINANIFFWITDNFWWVVVRKKIKHQRAIFPQFFVNFPQRNNDFSSKYLLLYKWISYLKGVKKIILIQSKLLHLYSST